MSYFVYYFMMEFLIKDHGNLILRLKITIVIICDYLCRYSILLYPTTYEPVSAHFITQLHIVVITLTVA